MRRAARTEEAVALLADEHVGCGAADALPGAIASAEVRHEKRKDAKLVAHNQLGHAVTIHVVDECRMA